MKAVYCISFVFLYASLVLGGRTREEIKKSGITAINNARITVEGYIANRQMFLQMYCDVNQDILKVRAFGLYSQIEKSSCQNKNELLADVAALEKAITTTARELKLLYATSLSHHIGVIHNAINEAKDAINNSALTDEALEDAELYAKHALPAKLLEDVKGFVTLADHIHDSINSAVAEADRIILNTKARSECEV